MNAPDNRPTKNEKRQEAREKARAMREEQSKRAKRNKVLAQVGWAVGVLGVISVVTVLIISSLRPPGPGPANMQSDGIKIGAGVQGIQTPALLPDELPVPSELNADGVPAISIFLDYSARRVLSLRQRMRPFCAPGWRTVQRQWNTTCFPSVMPRLRALASLLAQPMRAPAWPTKILIPSLTSTH